MNIRSEIVSSEAEQTHLENLIFVFLLIIEGKSGDVETTPMKRDLSSISTTASNRNPSTETLKN